MKNTVKLFIWTFHCETFASVGGRAFNLILSFWFSIRQKVSSNEQTRPVITGLLSAWRKAGSKNQLPSCLIFTSIIAPSALEILGLRRLLSQPSAQSKAGTLMPVSKVCADFQCHIAPIRILSWCQGKSAGCFPTSLANSPQMADLTGEFHVAGTNNELDSDIAKWRELTVLKKEKEKEKYIPTQGTLMWKSRQTQFKGHSIK